MSTEVQTMPKGPINIGLYELTIKETPDRAALKFLKRLGTADVPEYTPAITLTVEGETTSSKFTHDAEFSAQVGHFAYVRNKDNKGFAPTPYNPALVPAATPSRSTASKKGKGKK